MFAIHVFAVTLSHPDHMDVMQLFEHATDALACAYGLLRNRDVLEQTTPGYELVLTTADSLTIVQVTKHLLALDDEDLDPADGWQGVDPADAGGVTRTRLRCVPRDPTTVSTEEN